MKKYSFITLLVIISVLLSACGLFGGKYQQVGEKDGITVFLDSESANYDKSAGKISYSTKIVYNDSAKAKESSLRASHNIPGINPFVEMQYALCLYEINPDINKMRIVEINYMDKNDKTITRESFNDTAKVWQEIAPGSVSDKIYQTITNTLKKQNKL